MASSIQNYNGALLAALSADTESSFVEIYGSFAEIWGYVADIWGSFAALHMIALALDDVDYRIWGSLAGILGSFGRNVRLFCWDYMAVLRN